MTKGIFKGSNRAGGSCNFYWSMMQAMLPKYQEYYAVCRPLKRKGSKVRGFNTISTRIRGYKILVKTEWGNL